MEVMLLILLIILSGMFSGLTLGLLSLSITALERKIRMGDTRAVKVYSVRKNGSLLLCTLLLGNVAVNSAIAILLNSIASGFVAGLTATALIVVFGEILPQAIFNRYALSFGAKSVWLVKFFMLVLFPVAYPLAWSLDKFLGKESHVFWSKHEISEIIRHHEDSPESPIDADEERIILGALSFSDKQAYDVMTPKTVVYSLNINTIITSTLLDEIKQKGFSRIPVYEQNMDNMIGILFAKDLLGVRYDDGKTVRDYCQFGRFITIDWSDNLDKVLNQLVKSRIHIAFVIDEFGAFNGIVTLEDIVEEILKVEIVDEADKVDDMQKFARDRYKSRMA